jgi:sensor histidine kinase YesM
LIAFLDVPLRATAEVGVVVTDGKVVMRITDFGSGMPTRVVEGFRTSGSNRGVGLAGDARARTLAW